MKDAMAQENIKKKIRVLIVEDAPLVRRMVSEILSTDPEIEVVGVAVNGREGLEKIFQLNPDLVTLDIEMPVMSGLEALKEIRLGHKTLPVIMFSTLTHHGAAATLDALALGANDYVTKPNADGGDNADAIRGELVTKIKALCHPEKGLVETSGVKISPAQITPSPGPSPKSFDPCIEVLAIGVSTGGPVALSTLLKNFPKNFPIPVLIALHMPGFFTAILAERLSLVSEIQVQEGGEGKRLQPSQAWLAPGGNHMAVVRERNVVQLHIHQGPRENSCRPSVDVLFRSVVEIYGSKVLALVMTGMGQDGLEGCKAVREVGGQFMVQDQASSVVWGMPGLVAKAGLADHVIPLEQMGDEVLQMVRKGRNQRVSVG